MILRINDGIITHKTIRSIKKCIRFYEDVKQKTLKNIISRLYIRFYLS